MLDKPGTTHHALMMVRTRKQSKLALLFVALATVVLLCPLLAAGCGGSVAAKQDAQSRASLDALLKKGVHPNEMGMVMVLEYHRVQENEGDFVRSISNFKKDLQTLYDKNYRLISFHDLMTGNIGVPAGTTPVVFSFDDSSLSQFKYNTQGRNTTIDPNCALGIMQAFQKQHKDFGCTALFNVLPSMFDQEKYKDQKLTYLVGNGYDIGNHTVSHGNLAKLTDEQVQADIAGQQKNIMSTDPKTRVELLCLPYGAETKNQALMFNGSSGGTSYHYNWSLLVGSNPFYPMYHYKNPGQIIPRVQAMDYNTSSGSGADGSGYWLRYFDRHPELRFVSDGNSKTICAPAYMQTRLLPKNLPKGVQFLGY